MKKYICIFYILFSFFNVFANESHYKNLSKIEMDVLRNDKVIGYSNYFFKHYEKTMIVENYTKFIVEMFGVKVFSNYHILGTGADKDSALAEFHNTGLYWVEDKPKNALAGLNYGLTVLLYDRPYNRDFNHPDITRVNNWKQIHEILVK